MDFQQKVFVTCLLLQTGMVVWLTSGDRAKTPLLGNIFLALCLTGAIAFLGSVLPRVVELLNTPVRGGITVGMFLGIVQGALAVMAAYNSKTKKFQLDLLLEKFWVLPAAAAALVLWVAAQAGRKDVTAGMQAMHTLASACVVLSIVAAAGLAFAIPGGRNVAAYILGWMVPGAGHFIMGKRHKGLIFFGLLAGIYAFGLFLSNFRMVGYEDNPFYYVGQFGSGMTMLIGGLLEFEKASPRAGLPLSWLDVGLLYVCAAGLLNYVIALNALEVKAAQPAPAAPAASPAAAPERPPAATSAPPPAGGPS